MHFVVAVKCCCCCCFCTCCCGCCCYYCYSYCFCCCFLLLSYLGVVVGCHYEGCTASTTYESLLEHFGPFDFDFAIVHLVHTHVGVSSLRWPVQAVSGFQLNGVALPVNQHDRFSVKVDRCLHHFGTVER